MRSSRDCRSAELRLSSACCPANSAELLGETDARSGMASHAARLAELNIAPEVIAALPECAREPPVVGGVRVMSWNILAEGMSYDGFHVRDVIAPDEEGSPSADTFLQLFGELLAAKADGHPAAMEALKARLETARSRRNLEAVVDWGRRWRRMGKVPISAQAPRQLMRLAAPGSSA